MLASKILVSLLSISVLCLLSIPIHSISLNSSYKLAKQDTSKTQIKKPEYKTVEPPSGEELYYTTSPRSKKKKKPIIYVIKKKYKRFVFPLLIAYKLKYLTMVPVFIALLVLLSGSTGLAGFFFAMFLAVIGLGSK